MPPRKARNIFRIAKEIAESHPLELFGSYDARKVASDPSTRLNHTCEKAESRFGRLSRHPISANGEMRDSQGRPHAVVRRVTVFGLDYWFSGVPKRTTAKVLVKNPNGIPAFTRSQKIGERNVLLQRNGVAFLGIQLSPSRVLVSRPVLSEHQTPLQRLLDSVMRTGKKKGK